jgi:hypothetical protein
MTRKLVFAAMVVLAATLVATAVSQAQQAPRRGPAATIPVVPAKPAPPGPLPPVPFEQYLARPATVVQQVYEFAARHPEVLQYVPCYCGCQSLGHKGNHECFVKRRAADGRVLEWEPHGSGCAICVDVARDAMLMFNSGANVGSIRAAIDKKYGERATTQTPTPPPPARGLRPQASGLGADPGTRPALRPGA